MLLARRFDVVNVDLDLGKERGLSVAMTATRANLGCKAVMITGSTLFARGEFFEMAPSAATLPRKPVAIDEVLAVPEHGATAHQPVPGLERKKRWHQGGGGCHRQTQSAQGGGREL